MAGDFWLTLWHEQRRALVLLALLVALVAGSVVAVPETEQAVVMRMGEPVRVINIYRPGVAFGDGGAGLALRIPLLEQVVRVDRRLLSVETGGQTLLSADQQPLVVDGFARLRVIDPVRMVARVGSTDQLTVALQPALNAALRQAFATRPFTALLTAEREGATAAVRASLDKEARAFGAEVVDVRIEQTQLPAGAPLDAAMNRMSAAGQQRAIAVRAEGDRQAQQISGNAEAQATKIFSDSFGKDPGFYDFYRAMQSYNTTLANPANHPPTIVLTPDNDYLRQFQHGANGR